VLGLPPDVDGADDGDDEPVGCGSDGIVVWVDVLVAQPARPSAQAMGQRRPWT
jgi:hypothetical protein